MRGRGRITLFAVGNMFAEAVSVSEKLESQGFKNCLYSVHTLKPINKATFARIIKNSKIIIIIEEHISRNGLSTLINNLIVSHNLKKKVLSFSLPDEFIHSVGSQKYLRKKFSLTAEKITQKILRKIR